MESIQTPFTRREGLPAHLAGAVLDAVGQGVVVADGRQSIVAVNEAARVMLGLGGRDLVGQDISLLAVDPRRLSLRAQALPDGHVALLLTSPHPTPESGPDWDPAEEAALRRALARGELELHYQPLVVVATRRLAGFEALARWRHPRRGLLGPNEFIPLAEACGLIGDLGAWALETACRDAAAWPDELRVAVNVSGLQFTDGDLADLVTETLARHALPAHRLELELTESALLKPEANVVQVLTRLRAIGVRVSMDDFGTGYSSLAQLQSLPFDKLKIDRAFVGRLGGPGEGAAILRAIASMGASLGLRTLAEGVETDEQLRVVRREGCHEAQGYLFGRPTPLRELGGVMERFELEDAA